MTSTTILAERAVLADHALSPTFWNEYTGLWHNSRAKSPFQSPAILKYFSDMFANAVVAVRLVSKGQLIAAAILKRENGVYSFLSDLKSDTNFFVLHKDCSDEDIKFFFTGLFDIIKRQSWAVMLNRVSAWAEHMPLFEHCGIESNLFFQSMDYSVCPVLKCSTPEEIHNIISRTRTLRNNANNLKSKLNAEFEVLTGDEDLKNWVEEFCSSHILRWKNTSTPSVYRDAGRQLFLLRCLQSWIVDKVLVRFAVKVNSKRIGFHICLIEGDSLIGHSQTFHPAFHKLSPAKVLLLTIAEWMAENKLRVFDFGNGNEKYKYNYVNHELVLKKIFISNKTNFALVAKAKLIRWVKNNYLLYSFYQKGIKRFLNPGGNPKIKIDYAGK
jgi:hypothetical protein